MILGDFFLSLNIQSCYYDSLTTKYAQKQNPDKITTRKSAIWPFPCQRHLRGPHLNSNKITFALPSWKRILSTTIPKGGFPRSSPSKGTQWPISAGCKRPLVPLPPPQPVSGVSFRMTRTLCCLFVKSLASPFLIPEPWRYSQQTQSPGRKAFCSARILRSGFFVCLLVLIYTCNSWLISMSTYSWLHTKSTWGHQFLFYQLSAEICPTVHPESHPGWISFFPLLPHNIGILPSRVSVSPWRNSTWLFRSFRFLRANEI